MSGSYATVNDAMSVSYATTDIPTTTINSTMATGFDSDPASRVALAVVGAVLFAVVIVAVVMHKKVRRNHASGRVVVRVNTDEPKV